MKSVFISICETNGREINLSSLQTFVKHVKNATGDFSFQFPKSDIDFTKFNCLLPRTHLNGLELLLNQDIFMSCFHEVDKEQKILTRKKEDTAQKRLKRLKKLEKKSLLDSNKKKLSFPACNKEN